MKREDIFATIGVLVSLLSVIVTLGTSEIRNSFSVEVSVEECGQKVCETSPLSEAFFPFFGIIVVLSF